MFEDNLKLGATKCDVKQAAGHALHALGQCFDFGVGEFKLKAVTGDFTKVGHIDFALESCENLFGVQ